MNENARLRYIYAQIDLTDNMCVGVSTTTICYDNNPAYVAIPRYDESYLLKYYINGEWYEDEAGTIPWTPPV